jgi:clan AA aspartic protease (TIGR02281 family)
MLVEVFREPITRSSRRSFTPTARPEQERNGCALMSPRPIDVIKMDPEDRVLRRDHRRFPITLSILLVIIAIGGSALYWYASQRTDTSQRVAAPRESPYMEIYSKLGISPLPEKVAASGPIRRPLEQLSRERCDRQAIFDLGEALKTAGYRREAATAHVNFSEMCGGDASSLRVAANVLLQLSDYSGAAAVASDVIDLEPLYDNGYFLRALARDRGGLTEKAIDDYITAIELFGDKDIIHSVSYFNMARLYEKLGRFCDAVLPIESWVSLNPKHDTSQTRAIIANYMAKGKCARATSGRPEVFAVPHPNAVVNLPVTINGTRGTFILDTGATFVSLKNSFAQKASVEIDQGSVVWLRTANGVASGSRGRAQTVQLRSLLARDVPIVVQTSEYGEGIDGLLGMSFLSRFNLNIDAKTVRISPRTVH